jgi:hypothetical protein
MLASCTRRSLAVAVLIDLTLAAGPLFVPTIASAQHGYELKPVPSGLVAVIKNVANQPLDPKPFLSPYMSGVAIQIYWSDIEPVKGQPNWARLDEVFAAAHESHKWVQLLVFPGFFSPAWALEGAETAQFTAPFGLAKGNAMTLPMPWDPVYLGNYFAFLKQLSDRYGNRPEFLMIAAAGPTSVCDQALLPHTTADIKLWIQHGYTSTKFIHAWQQAFEVHARLFPNQYVSLSNGSGLKINAEGVYDPSEPQRTQLEIIGEGLGTLGSQFAYQCVGLHGNGGNAGEEKLLISFNGQCVTGFQMSTTCEKDPKGMGAAGSPPLACKRTPQPV